MPRKERRARKAHKATPANRRHRNKSRKNRKVAIGVMETIEVRRATALQCRCDGMSYSDIATTLGITRDTAYTDVQAELDLKGQEKSALSEGLFRLQNERYESVLRTHLPRARRERNPDMESARIVLKTLERIDRLNGIEPVVQGGLVIFPWGTPASTMPLDAGSGLTADVIERRIQHTQKRLEEAKATTIDWSQFERAADVTVETPTP